MNMTPKFTEATTNTVKTYYAGYGYSDSNGYEGYDTYHAFKYQNAGTNYTQSNLMYTLADSNFGGNPGETAVAAVMSVHWLGLPIEGYDRATQDLALQEEKLGQICYETAHDYLLADKAQMVLIWFGLVPS